METTCGSTQNKMSELTDKIKSICSMLNSSRNGLDAINNRFLGEEPECASNETEKSNRIGSIGALEESVVALQQDANQIINSISRLSNAGVI